MVLNNLTLGEKVVWDKEIYPNILPSLVERYGEGPFKVVGLSLWTNDSIDSRVATYQVTVELPDGKKQGFAGEWFARAKKKTECVICGGPCIGADA